MTRPGDSDGGVDGLTSEQLPVRMLNEFAYCPRLFHFMHVEGRWARIVVPVEGKAVPRRVDKLDHVLPDAVGRGGPAIDDPQSAAGNGGFRLPNPQPTTPQPTTDNGQRAADNSDGDDPPVICRSVPLGR